MAKKYSVSQNAIDIVAHLNNALFEAEQDLEQAQRQVSAARWYLAAEPTADNVQDLRSAWQRMRVLEDKVRNTKRSLEKALSEIYTL